MTSGREESEKLQQRTYMVILLLGLLGAVSALVTNELLGTISTFTRAIFYATIVLLASQIWLLRAKRVRVSLVRESVYAGIGAVLLGVLFYALYMDPPSPLREVSLVSLYLWFPFIYMFVFLAYESLGALARSGVLYLLALCISLPHAAATVGSRSPFEGFHSLGQFYIASASFIAVLYFFTGMKEQLRKSQERADQMALLAWTDPLTGVPNRRRVEVLLEGEIRRAARYDLPLSLITLDLDDFKRLNDTYGHDAGDAALVEAARLVGSCLRASDGFGRWGGEEFTVVAPETAVGDAWRLADRIRAAIQGHDFGGHRLSASFGVATYRPDDNVSTLIKRSDLALYRAKRLGKNRVETESIPA